MDADSARWAGDLVIPPGKKTGCLYRQYAPGQCCPLAAENMTIVPREEWSDWIGKINNSGLVHAVKDQNGVGSCATESTSQCVEMMEVLSGQPWVKLSPWFIYYHTSGGVDRGSSIDENLRFVREKGIAPDAIWPRSRGWRTRPSDEAYSAALQFKIEEFYDVTTTVEMGSCLLSGWPVVFGWKGHSVVATDLISPTRFRYCNSWGDDWGANGFGELSLSAVNWAYGAYAIRTTTHEGSR